MEIVWIQFTLVDLMANLEDSSIDKHQHRVMLARIKTLSRQRPIVLILNVLVMGICVFVLWSSQAPAHLLTWLFLNVALSIVRLMDWSRHRSIDSLSLVEAQRWLSIITIAAFAGGSIWGAGAWFFLNAESITVLAFFLITLIGVINGSTVSYAAHFPMVVAFAAPVTLLAALKLSQLNIDYAGLLALTTIAFLVFTIVVGRNYSAAIENAITLDLKNSELLIEAKHQGELAAQANLEKSRFFAAVSHDLRQPLYATSLLLESLGERLTSIEQKKLHTDIERTHSAVSDMFSSLLEVSQLDSLAVEPNITSFPLSHVFESLSAEFEPSANKKGISLSVDATDAVTCTDRALLLRILRNLLTNAIKFTPGGYVEVAVIENRERITVRIIDTGIGIANHELKSIFSEYYQLDNPERDRSKGSGLGLAVVHRLGQLLSLPISVESTVGKGSCFTIELPKGDASAAHSETPKEYLSHFQGLHTIIIDDDKEVLHATGLLLGDHGCVVTAETTVSDALRTIESVVRPADIILCDYRLRDEQTGIQAIAEIRDAIDPFLPALLITGDTDPLIRQTAERDNIRLLYKPLSPNDLFNAIADLV